MSSSFRLDLKLPLLGIEAINHSGKTLIHEKFCRYDKSNQETDGKRDKKEKSGNEKIRELETALGNYIKITRRYEEILTFLFPDLSEIEAISQRMVGAGSISKEKDKLPLFVYQLDKYIEVGKREEGVNVDKISAWASLMYDLGEFRIDELDHRISRELIPHIYGFDDLYYTWWANIPKAEGIVKKIWERLGGNDVCIVGIDDDINFPEHFLGSEFNNDNPDLLRLNKGKLFSGAGNRDSYLIWLNSHIPYDQKWISEQIEEIVEYKKKKLIVFVVDLIFKKENKSQVIEGDKLINTLRARKDINMLVVGLTGGTSPFIINSAEKAGADIVVFKKRGDDPVNVAGHSSGGNPVGVFDLLWAISWNVSVWRLLETYKNNYTSGHEKDFRNIALDFFPSIENVSPFWKEYLAGWQTAINNEKIRRLFGS